MKLLDKLKGDNGIWSFAILLLLASLPVVYSASSNLAYIAGDGDTTRYLVARVVFIIMGLVVMYVMHVIPYRREWVRNSVRWALYLMPFVLLYTLVQGGEMGGANAARWITIPIVNQSFQPSTLAFGVIMMATAQFLDRVANEKEKTTFWDHVKSHWVWIAASLVLILPANLSTALLIFSMVMLLSFIGQYRLPYLGIIIGAAGGVFMLFLLVVMAFPDISNRTSTWKARIDNFMSDEVTEGDYQKEKAKIAIASGGAFGVGPGKSAQKHFLPQSSSDFIYAIIVEEYGLGGALALLATYLLLFWRIVVVAKNAPDFYGQLLVLGLGLPIIIQAFVNMAVATAFFPVTGQTLPLISMGGTSMLFTCVFLGAILSVSARRQRLQQQEDQAKLDEEQKENPLSVLSEQL